MRPMEVPSGLLYLKDEMKSFPRIRSVFDQDGEHILYNGSIHNALKKLLPADFFFSDDPGELERWLPAFKWIEWGEDHLSLFLLCRHRANGVKFYYEMISRWLLPGKKPDITSFFATDFKLPDLIGETLTISEAVIALHGKVERALALSRLPILESEIRLGLTSVYHANRILEIKGLSADEKTSIIQEKIVALLERRPDDFDHDIFLQMQHFLVMCSEEFKAVRESAHLCRIIYVFYLLQKMLKMQMEISPGHRFVLVKMHKTGLNLPFGRKKVLGLFIALNLLGDNELFEERHLLKVVEEQFHAVPGSFFSRGFKDDRTQLLYLEIEKKDGTDLSLEEIRIFKETFSEEVMHGIEKLARPVFMPRNEEEVMRNIITLSNQLKLSHDLPQVVIAFDEQTPEEVFFTVIWLRVLREREISLQELFEGSNSLFKFIPDRIKLVGKIRKKYPKEATVFRLKCSAGHFLRSDHSVDLFKARQEIVEHLKKICGEFRDYNGGMIAKQHEQFSALKNLLSELEKNDETLLEKFFHSIYPIEMRSVFNPERLKKLFTMLLEAVEKNRAGEGPVLKLKADDGACSYLLLASEDRSMKEKISPLIASFEFLTVSLQWNEIFYLGVIDDRGDEEGRNKILSDWENLTFELQTVTLDHHEK